MQDEADVLNEKVDLQVAGTRKMKPEKADLVDVTSE